MYKISIIIPVFNVEEYISNAFNSILNQTIGFDNLQIIFVDDASTDNSSKIIDNYSNMYDNVISFHLKYNSGDAGKPRNVAMEHATADYLMFLDPDDELMDDACEILYDEITCDNLDIVSGVYCNGVEVPKFIWINTLTDPNDKWSSRRKLVESMVKDSSFSLKIDSIDDYPSTIANSNIWNKIFRKSFIIENDIKSPEGMPAQDSVFLFNAFLNAKGIKFINKIIVKYNTTRESSMGHQFSKKRIMNRLDAYYKMYYLSESKNKSEIFKHYLLFDKLKYFVKNHLMICNLPVNDIVDIFEYSMPLFKLYLEYNNNVGGEFAPLFRFIAGKDYENAIKFIYGDKIPNQKSIKIVSVSNLFLNNLLKKECNLVNTNLNDCVDQLNSHNPNFFIYEFSEENYSPDLLTHILNHCNKKNIPTIFFNFKSFCEDIYGFDYIFTNFDEDFQKYITEDFNNVFYFDNECNNLKNDLKLINDDYLYNNLLNEHLFRYILDMVGFKYVPSFSHIFLFYNLNDLNDLIKIYNHFNLVGYGFKHIKLISADNNSFLSDFISNNEITEIKKSNRYYFSYIDSGEL